jgi:hypothetical protein
METFWLDVTNSLLGAAVTVFLYSVIAAATSDWLHRHT